MRKREKIHRIGNIKVGMLIAFLKDFFLLENRIKNLKFKQH